eukprot:SAG31_NODE_9196_length_1317_cov_1.844007_1_plen_306_part_10
MQLHTSANHCGQRDLALPALTSGAEARRRRPAWTVRVVTFSFLCPLLEKYGAFIARCNALIEKVSSFRVDAVATEKAKHGVMLGGACPCGHHAHANEASGYGHYNEIVSAARRAIDKHGLDRVVVFDWDVHCGDGIEALLYDDPNILYCSIHRFDGGRFFPARHFHPAETGGLGHARGLTINIGWGFFSPCQEMGDEEYRAAFESIVLPVLRSWSPQLLIVFGGMDAAVDDPVGMCNLSPAMYGWMTEQLTASMACSKSAGLVILLTGGYDIIANKPGPVEVVRTLLSDCQSDFVPPPTCKPNFGG